MDQPDYIKRFEEECWMAMITEKIMDLRQRKWIYHNVAELEIKFKEIKKDMEKFFQFAGTEM